MTSLGENNAGSSHLMVASPSEELQRHIRENPIRQEWEFEFTEGGAEALSLLERRRYQGLLLDRLLRDLDVHEVISVATYSARPFRSWFLIRRQANLTSARRRRASGCQRAEPTCSRC